MGSHHRRLARHRPHHRGRLSDTLVNHPGAAFSAPFGGLSVNLPQTCSRAPSKAGLIHLTHLTKRMALRLMQANGAVSAIAAPRLRRKFPPGASAAICLALRAGGCVIDTTLVLDGGVTLSH